MDDNDMMNHNQQYNRMMQLSNHPNQNQMQYGQSNTGQFNNFGYSQAYSHQ